MSREPFFAFLNVYKACGMLPFACMRKRAKKGKRCGTAVFGKPREAARRKAHLRSSRRALLVAELAPPASVSASHPPSSMQANAS
eukprot:scaffold1166_cov261-Pinguiococcus_pyrenoidosus.AAC.48